MKRKDFLRMGASGLAMAAVSKFPPLSAAQDETHFYEFTFSSPSRGEELLLSVIMDFPINMESNPFIELRLEHLGEEEMARYDDGRPMKDAFGVTIYNTEILARNIMKYRISDYRNARNEEGEQFLQMNADLESYGLTHPDVEEDEYEVIPLTEELEYFKGPFKVVVKVKEALELTGDEPNSTLYVPYSTSESGCYLTTACTRAMGLPDDCHELTTLRNYRDSWLVNTEEGARLVKEYYRDAPAMVRLLDSQPNARQIHRYLFDTLVRPSVSYIERGEYRQAMVYYRDYVSALQKRLYGN